MTSTSDLFEPPCTMSPSPELLRDAHSSKVPWRVMYGETFDDAPLPIDAAKYYAWLTILARSDLLQVDSRVQIVVADDAVRLNKRDLWGDGLIQTLCEDRVAAIRSLLELWKSDVTIKRMSEIITDPTYRYRRTLSEQLLGRSDSFKKAVRGSVRRDHLEREAARGFGYSLDEIAVIADFDMKVGPPRETFYDAGATELRAELGLPPLVSVLLRPTYPFATSPAEFVRNQELGKFGVTAYKASSMGLASRRLLFDATSVERLQSWIASEGPAPRTPKAPSAVVESVTTMQLVRWARTSEAPGDWWALRWWSGEVGWSELGRALVDLFADEVSAVGTALDRH